MGTAKEYFNDWNKNGTFGEHTGSVPAVSWWKVGNVGKIIFEVEANHDCPKKYISVNSNALRMKCFTFSGCPGHVRVA